MIAFLKLVTLGVKKVLNGGLIEKLVELRRSELGGDLIEMGKYGEENEESGGGSRVDGVGMGEGNIFIIIFN